MPFKPPHRRNWNVEWSILLVALVLLATVLGFNLWREYKAIETREYERLDNLTQVIEAQLQHQFETINHALESLHQDWFYWQTQADGLERAQVRLDSLSQTLIGVRNLMIMDAQGKTLVASRREVTGTNFSNRDYFHWAVKATAQESFFLSQPFVTVLGTWGITLTHPIKDKEGRFLGVVTANLDRNIIDSFLSSLRYAPDIWFAVSHSNGTVFIVNPQQAGMEGTNLNQPSALFRTHIDSGRDINFFKASTYLIGKVQLLAARNLKLSTPEMVNSLVMATGRDPGAVFADWRKRGYELSLLFGLLSLATTGGLFSLQHHQKRIDAERQYHYRQLNLLVEDVPGMLYQFTLEANGHSHFSYASGHIRDIYELTPEEVAKDANALFDRIHPEDIERVRQSVLDSATHLSPWSQQYRILVPGRGERWLAGYSTPQSYREGAILWHGYINDITESKQQELALKQAKEAAEAANKAKDLFLANISHEVRTPLSVTLGHLQLLAQTDLSPHQQDLVTNAQTAASLLLAILNDILDLSKIEAGRLVLHKAPFSLDEMLGNLETILTVMAASKALEIHIQLDDKLPRILQADALRLQQVLLNLAGNAIKFTDKGCVCLLIHEIERSPNQVWVQFVVEDSGIGIAEERLEVIFDNFEQADASTARRFGGTGLGLAISQRLVHLMGGEIQVSSHLGQGSCFAFSLRLPWSLADQTPLSQQGTLKQDQFESEPRPLTGLRILVAEDNSLNQHLVHTLLTKVGAEVLIANNGQEALEIIRNPQPRVHAVLMDIQMPVMDGFEATRLIRTQVGKALPIIAMTANSLATDPQDYLEAGMDDHIAKPFNIHDLIALLLQHLKSTPGQASTLARPEPESMAAPASHIDSRTALKRLDNNEALYASLLKDFVASQADIPAQVQKALTEGDRPTALRLLHSLKGLAATLGILGLHKEALAAEAALKLGAEHPDWPEVLDRLERRLTSDVQQIYALAEHLEATPTIQPQNADTGQPRLLLVDDHPINLEVLKQIFSSHYDLLEAQNGIQALHLCRVQPRPDLILLDVLMPDMDGLEVCRQLKADPLTADIPIIFITAQTSVDEETAALECGGVDFISKPITPAVVRLRVKTQLTLKQQRDQLQALAMVDGLTGIANRRRFDEALQIECLRAQRHQTWLALLLIDIDHFKLYNDHYGHQQGDACLQQVAARLASGCRRALDLVARYGGEEFVCLLPDCDLDSAKAKAEELRQAIAALALPHAASPIADRVSISIGLAVCLGGDDTCNTGPQQLIATADKALYAAKAAGRNQVAF